MLSLGSQVKLWTVGCKHFLAFKTFLPVLSELIDDMAEKIQASLGVEEFSSLCMPSQVSPLYKCMPLTLLENMLLLFSNQLKLKNLVKMTFLV